MLFRSAEGADVTVLDVRRPLEFQAGHVPGAVHLPLHELEKKAPSLDRNKPVAIICASGYRSSIATSVLERLGFHRFSNVVGGMNAWYAARYDTAA